jgi:hypothetical protein
MPPVDKERNDEGLRIIQALCVSKLGFAVSQGKSAAASDFTFEICTIIYFTKVALRRKVVPIEGR